ncbi:hypothetical protein L6R52_32530 [Myxococcota bacterium]|nr:hypothetical protein [Myxococcota bacterium]
MRPLGPALVALSTLVALSMPTGCVRTLDVPLPAVPSDGAVLLVLDGRDSLRVYAADAGDPLPPLTPNETTAIHAIVYACDLDALQFVPGWQPQLTSGPFVVPQTGELFTFEPATSRWRTPDVWPDAIVPDSPSACAQFTTLDVGLPGTVGAGALSAVELDGERVLVSVSFLAPEPGAPAEGFFVVDRSGATRVPETILPAGSPSRGAFRDAMGRIHLVGADGRMIIGTLEGGFVDAPSLVQTATRACEHGLVWLDGARDGAPELYAVTSAPALQRWDGERWTVLAAFDRCAVYEDLPLGDVAWLGRGEGLAVVPDTVDAVWRIRGDRAVRERLPDRPLPVVPSAVARVPGWGLVVGARLGGLYLEHEGEWEILAPFSIDHVRSLGELDQSLLCSCGDGLVEIHPVWGRCSNEGFAVARQVRAYVPTDEGLALVTGRPSGVFVTFLTWTRPVSGCGR